MKWQKNRYKMNTEAQENPNLKKENIMDRAKLKSYLWFCDAISLLLSIVFLFKFEASYWLHKGSSVNQVAGFGDIFHDCAFMLFIACPLLIISQLFLSTMAAKWNFRKVLVNKCIAFAIALIIVNIKKLQAEIHTMNNWRAMTMIIMATLLFIVYSWIVDQMVEKKGNSPMAMYIPIAIGILGMTCIIIL
jgi:hypothetical protein